MDKSQICSYAEEKEAIYRGLCEADKLHTRLTMDVKLLLGGIKDGQILRTERTSFISKISM